MVAFRKRVAQTSWIKEKRTLNHMNDYIAVVNSSFGYAELMKKVTAFKEIIIHLVTMTHLLEQ